MKRVAGSVVTMLAIASVGCSTSSQTTPACSRPDGSITVLQAQSVPTATRLPCIADLPIGWSFAGADVRSDESTFWLDHDRAGIHAVEVSLRETCDLTSAVDVTPALDEEGMRVLSRPAASDPSREASRFQVFEGGCIEYRYSFDDDAHPSLVREAEEALSTVPRSVPVAAVDERFDLILCGAGAPPCEG